VRGNGEDHRGGPALDLEDVAEAAALVEAILFSAAEPVALERLVEVAGLDPERAAAALGLLEESLRERRAGVQLIRVAGGYQLRTARRFAAYLSRLSLPRPATLSQAALETLAVIAYQQPATRSEVEAVRGVSVDSTLSTLLSRRLIRVAGRKDAPGRPALYVTTAQFLEYFGLEDLGQLPPLSDVAAGSEDGAGDETAGNGRPGTGLAAASPA